MLGLTPAPQGALAAKPNVYGAPLTGAVLVTLGTAAFGLLTMMPDAFQGISLVRTLMALALTAGGLFGIMIGYVTVSTRIEVAPEGVCIATPGWRACPYPPVQEYRIRWEDVRAVHHRTEAYRIGPLRLPLDAYAIETTEGPILLGGYYLADLEPVLIELAHRADRPWREHDEVEASLLRTICRGAPAWPALGRRGPA